MEGESLSASIAALAQEIGADIKGLRTGKQDAVLFTVIEAASWDYAVEVTSPSIVVLTLTAPACTLAVQAPCQSFRLALVQGTGANKVTWPSNVRWPYGVPPVLSYTQGHIDLFEFLSPNADGQWFGFFLGGGF